LSLTLNPQPADEATLERSGGLTILAPHARRRARAPHPAQPAEGRRPTIRRPPFAAAYALLVALALLALALIDNAGRHGASDTGTLFWLPLLAMLLPGAFRLCSTDASSAERVALLVLLGGGLYVAKVLLSPAEFTFSDELSTLRTTKDLATTGGLLTPNTLARGFALYPGVDLSTLSLAHASALPLFTSGLLVIGTAKLVLVLAVFGLLLHASGSERVASIAALVYIANPNFLFFDAQFSYESLALALALATLALVALALDSPNKTARAALTALAALAGLAVAPTHHITSYALVAVLALWAPTLAVRRRRERTRPPAWPAAAVLLTTGLAVGAWLTVVGSSTGGYLRPVITDAVESTYDFLTGSGVGKTPFHSAGEANSHLEQALGLASVLILLCLLAVGLWRLRRQRPASALAWVLVAMAALYPASLALRLTQAGTETSNRASEFLFLGLALVAGGVLASRPAGSGSARTTGGRLLVTALVGVLFVGGVVIGWPPASRVPGRALIEADTRSVEPYDIAAARWAAGHLPRGSRIVADRANGLLMSAYAGQDPLIGAVRDLPFAAIITSAGWGPTEDRLIAGAHIEYVVVDRRLASHLPALGIYVDHDETGANAHRTPLSSLAIAKFEHRRSLRRIYDNGPVAIYQVLGLPGVSR
jgi:hypothetical protein